MTPVRGRCQPTAPSPRPKPPPHVQLGANRNDAPGPNCRTAQGANKTADDPGRGLARHQAGESQRLGAAIRVRKEMFPPSFVKAWPLQQCVLQLRAQASRLQLVQEMKRPAQFGDGFES